MAETEIQIDDPSDPADLAGPGGAAPYRNLWVPLVVVPATIVIAFVVVVAMFGAIAGDESGPERNLERVVHGGANERKQALFNLVVQLTANHEARRQGAEPPYPVPPDFLAALRAAVAGLEDDDPYAKLILGVVLADLGEERAGGDVLLEALELTDEQDPERRARFYAIANLGMLGEPRAAEPVLEHLDHEDPGLRTIAASALQRIPGPGVRAGLRTALDDHSLEVRGTAALSLTRLDPPDAAAAPVLRSLLEAGTYAAENERDPSKYRTADLVSALRARALEALLELGLAEDDALLVELRSDADPRVAELALRALGEREQE